MIIKIRNESGLTQDDVGELGGVPSARVAQVEAGIKLHKTSFDVFLRILQVLGYQPSIRPRKLEA